MSAVPPELLCSATHRFLNLPSYARLPHVSPTDSFKNVRIAAGKVFFTPIHFAEIPPSSALWER